MNERVRLFLMLLSLVITITAMFACGDHVLAGSIVATIGGFAMLLISLIK